MRIKFITPALIFAAAVSLGLAAAPANAANASGMMKSSGMMNVSNMMSNRGCTACHAESNKVVGPAWGWVAYRYKGENHQKAVQAVAKFIIVGGTGYWSKWTGSMPMPSHPNISRKQVDAIATWILKQPPIKPPKS